MSAAPIEVRITPEHLAGIRSEHIAEARVVSILREAGIPVVGEFVLRGVSRGVLTRMQDPGGVAFSFVWRDTPPKSGDLFKDNTAGLGQ